MSLFAYRALALLLVVAALFASGWWSGSSHTERKWQARIDAQERAALELAQRQARRIAEIDTGGMAKLTEARHEIDRMRADVAAGAARLRVAARCPVRPAIGAGVGDGAPRGSAGAAGSTGDAHLDATAEPAYFALRNGIARQHEQLAACQSILTAERAE